MSNWGFDDNGNATDLDNANGSNGPKALRDAYEAMKKQNEELNQKLTSFLEEQTRSKMATVFESLGVPGAQSVYQGEADPEKAKAWVDSMRSVFGGAAPEAAAEQPAQSAVSEEQRSQFERMTQAGANGVPLGNVEAAQAAVNDASDPQALIEAFKRMNF